MGRMKRPGRVAVGDRVRFEGQIRGVLAVAAQAVTLAEGEEPYRVVPLLELFAAADFKVVDSPVRMPLPAASLLEAFPAREVERALWWEGHILEVLHGLPPGAEPGTAVRPEYGPERSLTARQRAKAAELTAAGHKVSASTVAHRRRRYQERGVLGLADHRPVRRTAEFGEVDDAVVAAMRQAIKEAVDASTRTGTFILWRTGEILKEAPGGQGVGLPSQRTLYRLLAKLTSGTHTSGSAVTRRSRAHGATTPHGELPVFAPGEVMQIDSTSLDVLVLLDNGVTGRVELTAMIDVATRTLTAAVLRPTTKAVDASVLLARTVTPELMRPGWAEALRMSRSVLPHRRLLALDERLAHAAARPVIVPAVIVCDHGKAFLSRNFISSCRFLEIEVQPAHQCSPFEKGHIEKMLGSVATLFAQFLPTYTGRSVEHRGRHLERERVWSLLELQELLDEWIVAKWQNRKHDGLRDPVHPGRLFTPNEKYAALVEACGYVPVALSGDDYVELLPAEWRVVNDYGIRIKNRTYDSRALGPMRRQNSGVRAKRGLWEVHRDPYDVSRIWVRNHRGDNEWVPATWKFLNRAPIPFGDLAWDHVSHQLPRATRGGDRRRGRRPAHPSPRRPADRAGTGARQTRPAGGGPHESRRPAHPGIRYRCSGGARGRSGRERGVGGRGDPARTVRPAGRPLEALMTASSALPQDSQRHLTTIDGWRRFVEGPPGPPPRLTDAQYDALGEAGQAAFDEARLDHHGRLLVVATSVVRHTVATGRRLVVLNRHAISARRGLIVSGPAGTGKTIAITQLGLSHELLDRARHPTATDRKPVIYITVPPAATPRMIAAEFARFLGLPVMARMNITDLIESVVGVCTDARTGMILVDELHNISLTTQHGAEVADTLKYFSERIPATFIYAGIDIEHGSLLTGTRGAQIAGRFTLIPTHPFPYNSEWRGLVATMEKTLALRRHRPGTLARLDRYLHDRTGGMIGALSHQIRGAAIDAIFNDTEKITKAGLKAVPLDVAAESPHFRGPRSSR